MNKSTETLSNPTLERCIIERYTITEDRDKKRTNWNQINAIEYDRNKISRSNIWNNWK